MSKSKKQNLLDDSSSEESSSDSEGEGNQLSTSNNSSKDEVRINRKYATEYQSRKQKEELAKARMSGDYDDGDDGSSSDESSEDEDGELLTTDMDVSILKTINALRSKDKRIYDPSNRFFKEEEGDNDSEDENDDSGKQDKKHKPKRFKDVIREQILQDIEDEEKEENGKVDDSDDDGDGKVEKRRHKEAMSKLEYDEEQKNLRSAFFNEDADDDEEEDWMVFKKKGERADSRNIQETEELLMKQNA